MITGTGRCGTSYAARYLTELGISCSHEGYYTSDGPKFRNPERPVGTRGDVSWLAAPFVHHAAIPVVHLVRRPLHVIHSLYSIGFFDRRMRALHGPFVAFAERHFDIGNNPLDACIRWYVEWNRRCERAAGLRIQVEHFEARLPVLIGYIGVEATRAAPPPPPTINSWPAVLSDELPMPELERRVRQHARAGELSDMALRYGYGDGI